jgi:hypothetical protein
MVHLTAVRTLPLLAMVVAIMATLPQPLPAQEPDAFSPAASTVNSSIDELQPVSTQAPSDATIEQLLQRLQQTEARLAAMQAQLAGTQSSGLLETLNDRWQQVRDPSITTVDQQTYKPEGEKETPKKWYDRLSIRGYAQFRLNEVMSQEGAPSQHVGDRSIGLNQNFLIRRARVIISGDVSDHLYVYLQPDFASSVSGSAADVTYFTQIRDWYGDVYFDTEKVFRLRMGQSKVPYGWENMQSSSNRIPLDRSDGMNSAVRNERDLGMFFYWTPEYAQDLFKYVLDEGLKGSGNYGVFGVGVYNGQGGSFNEQNENLHAVARLTLPHQFAGGQIVEASIQAYTGEYAVLSSIIDPPGAPGPSRPAGTLETGERNQLDERVGGTFIWYPQPIGFQVEWNTGHGPALNAAQTLVETRSLSGGYFMLLYRHETDCWGTFFPFVRYQHYQGGYKAERNAPYSLIDEFEAGAEWQISPQMELTMHYTHTNRTNTLAQPAPQLSYQQFSGDLLRMQFQINY